MKLIGAHQILRLLGNGSVVLRRKQLRAYRGIENIEQHRFQLLLPAGIRIVADQMADQSLRHRGVHPVHGHMVAIIGSPSESQLRHISRSDYHASRLIGNIHENLGPLSGLRIFVGHIVDGRIVVNVAEMDVYGVLNVHLQKCGSQLLRQQAGVMVSSVCGSKAGHGDRINLFLWKAGHLEGLHCHQKSQGGVKTA